MIRQNTLRGSCGTKPVCLLHVFCQSAELLHYVSTQADVSQALAAATSLPFAMNQVQMQQLAMQLSAPGGIAANNASATIAALQQHMQAQQQNQQAAPGGQPAGPPPISTTPSIAQAAANAVAWATHGTPTSEGGSGDGEVHTWPCFRKSDLISGTVAHERSDVLSHDHVDHVDLPWVSRGSHMCRGESNKHARGVRVM